MLTAQLCCRSERPLGTQRSNIPLTTAQPWLGTRVAQFIPPHGNFISPTCQTSRAARHIPWREGGGRRGYQIPMKSWTQMRLGESSVNLNFNSPHLGLADVQPAPCQVGQKVAGGKTASTMLLLTGTGRRLLLLLHPAVGETQAASSLLLQCSPLQRGPQSHTNCAEAGWTLEGAGWQIP